MSPSHLTPTVCAAILFALLSGPLLAQGENPSIRLTSSSGPAFETDESSIALEGSAVAEGGLANIHWVNQFEQRGRGAWSGSAKEWATWTIADIPLHLGINLLTVTAVDAANRSATLHLAVNRKPALGAPPQPSLKIGTGIWQNRQIVYQLWKGQKIIEGDIILDPAPLAKTAGPGQSVAKSAINPDGMGISYTSQLWPVEGVIHVVPYVRSDTNTNLTNAIADFNAAFKGLIQFNQRSAETPYVNITVEPGFPPGEGMSNVGISSTQPNQLECSDSCTEATWLHEMGHTVGLMHEHQRPDRDTYITLNLANADLPNVPGNFTLVPFDYQTLGLYDYASIMHYGAFDFSKAGLPVLESIPAGIPLSNDTGYSAGDIDQVERLYGAVPSQVTVTTNPPGLSIIVDTITYTAPHTFSVALNSTLTLNLPPDPQNTNPADGSTYGFGNWNDKKARFHTVTITPGAGTLAAPASAPAVTVYQANFIRYQPFAFMTPAAFPSGSGTVHTTPAPKAKFGDSVDYYVDRTLVKLTLTQETGFSFYDWFNMPFPPSDNPKSFYIQFPLTAAQAVSMATTAAAATASGLPLSPVTIVGETITGPNTWNPPLTGTVDGNFAFLPTGFTPYYDDDGMGLWDPGTRHKVSVEQTQSPVTTNVYYNWNSWSDKGAITHTFLQPTTGGKKLTASFTPFYASYTSTNSGCGSVTTFPAGVSYPLNPSFSFYEDGTAVSATANPPSGMLFVGWSGSLTGDTNPSPSTAIDDQFVPIGNFNLTGTTAPLAVTSLVPATATARSTGLKLTINGTGFTSGTFVDWNGKPRTPKYVSPTELTVQLQAGDLASPGGQDLFLGNSTGSCAVFAEVSFTVK